jgi:AcrR family transcriptional regulator
MEHAQEQLDLRVRRTHKLLWESLLKLMKEREFESVSVKDICEQAMVHRTTFYNHYEDKYDLLKCGMRETYEKLMAESNIVDENDSAYQTFFTHVMMHRALYQVMLCGNGASIFQSWLRDRFAESLVIKLQQVELSGKRWDVPLPMLAHFYSGAVVSTLTWWISNNLAVSPNQMSSYLQKLLVEVEALKK